MTNEAAMQRSRLVRKLVRKLYKDQGCEVCISREGNVRFKSEKSGQWLNGRSLTEYCVYNGIASLI
jgi:hypothetical protein